MTGVAADMLADVPLFAALTDTDRAALAGAMERRSFVGGAALMVQNDVGDGLHIVACGTVRVGRRLPGGGFADTARLGPGNMIGEMALVGRGGRRTATVLADGAADTLFLPAPAFRAALGQLRPASLAMQRTLGAELACRALAKTRDIAGHLAAQPQAFTPRTAPRHPDPQPEAAFEPAGFVAKMPLGDALSPEQQAQLLAAGKRRNIARGERLDDDTLWLVVRGALRSDLPLPPGSYQLEVLGPGRLAGAASMLAGTVAVNGLAATESSLLLGWDKPAFRALLAGDDAVAMRLGAAINADLVITLDALDGVEARIAAMQRAVAAQ